MMSAATFLDTGQVAHEYATGQDRSGQDRTGRDEQSCLKVRKHVH
jgi:hypothetical protein